MTAQWRTRVLVGVCGSALIAAGAAVTGDGLDLVAFVMIAFCAASLVWLGTDLTSVAESRTSGIDDAPTAGVRRGLDLRTTRLSRRLAEIGRAGFDDTRVWSDLVDLADDRLLRHHDIDRQTDPERAASVLGPRLAAFVSACPPPRQFSRRSYLDAIVTDIEEL